MHGVIALYGYNNGGAILTLVLPLGLFIIVMIAMYVVFSRPHTVPGHRPLTGAKPVAPSGEAAAPLAAATGFPTATSAGGTEPLADRATPPVVGAGSREAADEDATATRDTATGDTASGEPAATENPEETE